MTNGNVTFTVALPFWQTLERAAAARGISIEKFLAEALARELARPQPRDWEPGVVAVALAAQERHEAARGFGGWTPGDGELSVLIRSNEERENV